MTDKTFQNKFIRDQIPPFDVPPYDGERYEDTVPATLDIQERCALAVNGLTGPTDPERDHLLYMFVSLMANPPMMGHTKSDICQIKHMEALPLMRIVSGSDHNAHVDPAWMATALRMIGPDGLAYWPSLPWGPYPDWCEPCEGGAAHYAMPFMCGRLIGAMTIYSQRDPDGPWIREMRKVVEGLRSVAIDKDDFAYFPHGGFAPHGDRRQEAEMPVGIFTSLAGWTTQGLAQHHRSTGDEMAVDLASRLARYIAYHGRYYGPDGEFLYNDEGNERFKERKFHLGPPPVGHRIHFQHHMVPLLGLIDHAVAAGDHDLAEFVNQSFCWARSRGIDLVGFFQENIGDEHELETCESCEVAGMIGLALKLSAAGVGDYWDAADRWIRNQFAENQLLEPEWIYKMCQAGLEYSERTRVQPSAIDPESQTNDRVPERNVGAFAGWATANDWFVGHGSGIMHCCTGNATRALYYIWEHMLGYDAGELRVNLLLNRPSVWADVHSHLPFTGQIDVHVKQNLRKLRVRLPQWAEPSDVTCAVNGKVTQLGFEGRYALLESVSAGELVSLTFPLPKRVENRHIEKRYYEFTLRGNEVVDVYPRGRFYPLYQRSAYRLNTTCWKKVDRFVSNETIWW